MTQLKKVVSSNHQDIEPFIYATSFFGIIIHSLNDFILYLSIE